MKQNKPNPCANKRLSLPILILASLIYSAITTTNVKNIFNSTLVSKSKFQNVCVWKMFKTMVETFVVVHFGIHHRRHMPSQTSVCQ